MAPSESNLSSPKYGYDFIVALTQASINATMLEFMSSRQEPVANVCYIANADGQPEQIDYEELKSRAGGTDPFSVPDAVSSTNPALTNLIQARFMGGFQAQIGIPPMDNPKTLPDIVTLGSDTTEIVYNMYCSEFTIVSLNPGGPYSAAPSFMKRSQPKNNPWVFRSKVNLNLSQVGQGGFSTLPPVVQAQIKNMSDTAFSIQQLLFDLNTAALSDFPTLEGVAPGTPLWMMMQQYFTGAYFNQLKKDGQPMLGCAIVHQGAAASTMTITDLNMEVCPYVDGTGKPSAAANLTEQSLATLNYLCAADGAQLPPSVPFSWNWVDPSDMTDHDGILSINRTTFTNYFRQMLAPYVPKACIKVYASVTADGLGSDMSWNFTPGENPTVTTPGGQTVLQYDYNSSDSDQAGVNGALGHLSLNSTYSMTVDFVNNTNTIVIKQHLVIYCDMKKNFTSEDGNIFDKTIVDTYTIAVTDDGGLQTTLHSDVADNSVSITTDAFQNFFTHMNEVGADVKTAANDVGSSGLTDIPVSTLQKYVFPGGKSFIFKDARFSNNQDLFASISYADTTGPMTVPP
ncbi:hypothetical protein BKA66DRAFT_575495 [Pyrenochaeta sp. MPI-SDFR-AT-0127]|nr:hypothetical protein BKA66DRAFT_575495 [Pyrenochaeta sp. MPI-SDFR-AT-0127]